MENIEDKFNNLKTQLKNLNKVAIAFSYGVDSTFLLKIAHNILKENVTAITINSILFPKEELFDAAKFCKKENIKHRIIDIDIFKIENFKSNPPNRCYFCKKELFKNIINAANSEGIENILEGSNIDDISDYRPGMKALEEYNIISPLKIAQLNKNEIRILSKRLDLPTFDKPSMACLASRIPYKETINIKKLNMIEKSENIFKELGFKQYRVRLHGDNLARIEIECNEFNKFINYKELIVKTLKDIGFKYVTLDMQGYRSGSLNEVL